jgi:hypothetical protein
MLALRPKQRYCFVSMVCDVAHYTGRLCVDGMNVQRFRLTLFRKTRLRTVVHMHKLGRRISRRGSGQIVQLVHDGVD